MLRLLSGALIALTVLLAGCSDDPAAAPARTIAQPLGVAAASAPALKPPPIPAPPSVQARGYFLMDFVSGQVLAATQENERLEPASLTKLMTAYAVFHALKDGRIRLDDQVRISAYARDQDGSRMFVEAGTFVTV
jgi:D-alanyl-D-alanine carboxypeptidase (penicillin-binding protein 5/6)